MLIHGSELVAVAQGLVEYWDSRWIFSALRQYLEILSTTVHAESSRAGGGDDGGRRGGTSHYDNLVPRKELHMHRCTPVGDSLIIQLTRYMSHYVIDTAASLFTALRLVTRSSRSAAERRRRGAGDRALARARARATPGRGGRLTGSRTWLLGIQYMMLIVSCRHRCKLWPRAVVAASAGGTRPRRPDIL